MRVVVPKERWERIEQYLEYLRHLVAYAMLAKQFVDKKKALEIGCGSGYGANYLSQFASSIVAIDISPEYVSYCQEKYNKDNLIFISADGCKLPFNSDSFDVVLSFQVIEHIDPRNVLNYLLEIKRVLRNGKGISLLSTPNARVRLLPFQKPWNPEHKKEYKDEEFKELLRRVFEDVKVYGLCSSSEIQAIGYGRMSLYQKLYRMLSIYRMLSNFLPQSILSRLKKITQHLPKRHKDYQLIPQETFVNKFSLQDFRVNTTCPKDCLDLYGICRKG